MNNKVILFLIIFILIAIAVVLITIQQTQAAEPLEPTGVPIEPNANQPVAANESESELTGKSNKEGLEQVKEDKIFSVTEEGEISSVYPESDPGVFQSRGYQGIKREISSLNNNLPPDKISEYKGFLAVKKDKQDELTRLQLTAVKNDLLDKLIEQKNIPDGLGRYIVSMYRDQDFDIVWRDFCVQRFAIYHEHKWPDGKSPVNDPDANALKTAFWDAAREFDTSLAGTALIGLEKVSRVDPGYDRARIVNQALSYARDDNCPQQTRVTALQVCGVMGVPEVVSTARQIAEQEEGIHMRMSAIATIGDVGKQSDIPTLEQIANSSNSRYIKNSVNTAIKKIKGRL